MDTFICGLGALRLLRISSVCQSAIPSRVPLVPCFLVRCQLSAPCFSEIATRLRSSCTFSIPLCLSVGHIRELGVLRFDIAPDNSFYRYVPPVTSQLAQAVSF